jgi:spore coat protein CotH
MTKSRDAFIHKAVKGVIDIDVMDSRPCVVYINGEYWGLYNIREKVNEDYLASHHGVDPKKVDILVWNGYVKAGNNEAYKDLIDYVSSHDMRNQEYYEYVASQMDIDNFIDYLIVECYFGNTDSGNIMFWRDQNGGKWRWILYDMDWALFKETYTWNNIFQIFNPNGMGFDDWIDTTLHVKLMKNANFKREFIKRYALYINTYFSPERLLPMFDAMIAEIRSEMPRQLERWPIPANYDPWEDQVASMRQIIIEKPEIEKKNLQEFFGLSNEEMQELFP